MVVGTGISAVGKLRQAEPTGPMVVRLTSSEFLQAKGGKAYTHLYMICHPSSYKALPTLGYSRAAVQLFSKAQIGRVGKNRPGKQV